MGFDPVSLAFIATTAASGVMSAMQQRAQGAQADATAKYNAQVKERQAQSTRDAMLENLRRQNDDKQRALASFRVRAAASNLDTEKGAPLAVLGDLNNRLDERIESVTNDALHREASLYDSARMERFAGKQANKASKTAAFGTLLSTAGQVGGQYRSGVKDGSIPDTFGLYR